MPHEQGILTIARCALHPCLSDFSRGEIFSPLFQRRLFDLPMFLGQMLAGAESKGRFFNERIRDHFRYQRVDEAGQ